MSNELTGEKLANLHQALVDAETEQQKKEREGVVKCAEAGHHTYFIWQPLFLVCSVCNDTVMVTDKKKWAEIVEVCRGDGPLYGTALYKGDPYEVSDD